MIARIVSLLLSISAVAQLSAQNLGIEEFVPRLYRDVLGREGKRKELAEWSQTIRGGTSMREVHVQFLASDENLQRYERDPGKYVTGLYAHLYRRVPRPAERQYWADRAVKFGGDRNGRVAFIREFVEHAESYGHGLPFTPIELPDAARTLAGTARLVVKYALEEIGVQGRAAQARADAALSAAQALEQILVQDRTPTPRAARALDRMELANQDLQRALARSPNAASVTRKYADLMGKSILALRTVIPPPNEFPPR